MDKGEQVMAGLWDMYSKRIWLDEIKMKQRLAGYYPSEIHCIEQIGRMADPNVTKLADAFAMTRSAISKLTRKLMDKGLVESYRRPDNRKEIYFRLTGQGVAVDQIHRQLHDEYRERDRAVFEQVTDAQYDSMLAFVDAYNRHLEDELKKLDVDLKSGRFDKL